MSIDYKALTELIHREYKRFNFLADVKYPFQRFLRDLNNDVIEINERKLFPDEPNNPTKTISVSPSRYLIQANRKRALERQAERTADGTEDSPSRYENT